MDRFDFFFRQKVTEAELDAAFDAVENSLKRLMLDNGVVGITSGGQVTENAGTPNLTVDVAGPATIYDQEGQRISWSATQDLDCSVDENSNSTAVVNPGNSKWLTIFAQFKRSYSDNRLDGEGATIQYNQAESFELHVVQGSEAVTPTKPALRGDEILLDDILIIYGQTQIQNSDIDDARRQWAFKTTSGHEVAVGQIEQAIQVLADAVDATEFATGIEFTGPSQAFHDTTQLATQSVQQAINKIVELLADDSTYGNGGADKIGTKAIVLSGTYPTLVQIGAGSIYDQLQSIYNTVISQRVLSYLKEVWNWKFNIIGSNFEPEALIYDEDNDVYILLAEDATTANVYTGGGITSAWNIATPGFGGSDLDEVGDAVYNKTANQSVVVGMIAAATGAGIQTSSTPTTSWTERTPPASFVGAGAKFLGVAGESTYVVAVGINNAAGGEAAVSANGGSTWAARTMPSACTTLRSVATDGSNWIAVGDNAGVGKIFRISGAPTGTWIDETPGVIAQANSVVFDTDHDVFLVVTDDEILYSDDGGLNWTDVSPDDVNKNGVVALSGSNLGIWIARSTGGTIYVSYNKGANWKKESIAVNDGGTFRAVGTQKDYGHKLIYLHGRLVSLGNENSILFYSHKSTGGPWLP